MTTVARTGASQNLLSRIAPDGATTTRRTDALYAASIEMHRALHDARAAFAAIELDRRAADHDEENPQVMAFFEQIKQTCAGAAREIEAAGKSIDRICDASWFLDQHGLQMASSLARPGGTGHALIGGTLAPPPERRAADQDVAVESAFVGGTLPETDRRDP